MAFEQHISRHEVLPSNKNFKPIILQISEMENDRKNNIKKKKYNNTSITF